MRESSETGTAQPMWLALEDFDNPGRFTLDDEITAPTLLETDLPESHWWNTLEPMSRIERWHTGELYFDVAEELHRLSAGGPAGEAPRAKSSAICAHHSMTATDLAEAITDRALDDNGIRPLLAEAAERVFRVAWLVNDIAAHLNAGHPPPEPSKPDDEPPEWTTEDIDPEPEPEPMTTTAPRFTLLSPADLAALPPLRWRVRGVLPAEGLAALYGPPGSGKSFLALDLLAAIADGRAWFGHTVTPCACVYVGLEGEAGVAQRVQAYLARHGSPERLRVVLNGLDIRRADDRQELAEAIRAAGIAGGLLCVDTLSRSAPGLDENDASEMGMIIEAMKALQSDLGGLVLVVHHTGKDSSRGLRGHSSLLAALDCVLEVNREGERREWKLAKAKDGDDDKARPFRLDVVELPPDADGWPVSSCVIQQEEPAADAVRRVKTPKGGNQRIIWDGVGELLRDSQAFGQGEAPPTRPCILLEDAINHLRTRLAVPTARQSDRTRAAITGLVSSGLLNLREGWLWCA